MSVEVIINNQKIRVRFRDGTTTELPEPESFTTERPDDHKFRIQAAVNQALQDHYAKQPKCLQTAPAQTDEMAKNTIRALRQAIGISPTENNILSPFKYKRKKHQKYPR